MRMVIGGEGTARRRRALSLAVLFVTASSMMKGQMPAERDVRGRVFHPTAHGADPVAGAWVTIHRVGADRAGPLDSMRTDAAGRYAFHYRASGDSNAVYFVATTFGGIAYFTPALRDRHVADGDGNLTVYDTTSTPVTIQVRGRHIVVSAPDSTGLRTMIEIFELSNDSSATRIPGAANRPTFEAMLPAGARDPRAGDGDTGAGTVTFEQGRMRLFAPIAPGMKQLSFNYHLPVTGTSVVMPVGAPATVLEVLVEDAKGSASGAELKETAAVALEGRNFRRFLAHDVPAHAVISIAVPTRAAGNGRDTLRIAIVVTVIGAAMLLGLAGGFLRRGSLGARAHADDPDALAQEIARLDVAFERHVEPTDAQRADHYEARARLKARLTAALARRDAT